jgi:hypothetical protein
MSFLPPAAGTQYCPFAKNGKGGQGGRPNPVSFSAEGGGLAISQAAKTPVPGAKNCVKTQIMLNLTHALTQFARFASEKIVTLRFRVCECVTYMNQTHPVNLLRP